MAELLMGKSAASAAYAGRATTSTRHTVMLRTSCGSMEQQQQQQHQRGQRPQQVANIQVRRTRVQQSTGSEQAHPRCPCAPQPRLTSSCGTSVKKATSPTTSPGPSSTWLVPPAALCLPTDTSRVRREGDWLYSAALCLQPDTA